MDKYFEYYGRTLSSILGLNRLLSGKYEYTKTYLKEINPLKTKSKETFTE